MKKNVSLLLSLILIICFNSCKKGCTDPLAYNYNSNRTIDNGSCRFYDLIYLDSLRLTRFDDANSLGNNWESGDSLDYDNDNSYPDVYIKVKTPSGYLYDPFEYYEDISPFNPDLFIDYNDNISSNNWQEEGFVLYIYDYELNSSFQLMDSVEVMPFNYNGTSKSRRYIREHHYNYMSNGIGLSLYFHWEE